MALGSSPSPLGKVRGKIGDLVYKWYGDRLVVTRAPRPSTKKPSKPQQAGRERFALASRYAERARHDAEVWSLYEAVAKKRRVPTRAIAIQDYLTPPKIATVDLGYFCNAAGAEMGIIMADRYGAKTASISVALADEAGKRLESGPAARTAWGTWHYSAVNAHRTGRPLTVVVTAKDRLGKTATARFSGRAGGRKATRVKS